MTECAENFGRNSSRISCEAPDGKNRCAYSASRRIDAICFLQKESESSSQEGMQNDQIRQISPAV